MEVCCVGGVGSWPQNGGKILASAGPHSSQYGLVFCAAGNCVFYFNNITICQLDAFNVCSITKSMLTQFGAFIAIATAALETRTSAQRRYAFAGGLQNQGAEVRFQPACERMRKPAIKGGLV